MGTLLVQMFRGFENSDDDAATAARHELDELFKTIPKDVLLSELHGRRLYNIAVETFSAGRYNDTLEVLNWNSDFGDARLEAATLRVDALRHLGRFPESYPLARETLTQLKQRAQQLQQEIDANPRVFATQRLLSNYQLGKVQQMLDILGEDGH